MRSAGCNWTPRTQYFLSVTNEIVKEVGAFQAINVSTRVPENGCGARSLKCIYHDAAIHDEHLTGDVAASIASQQ
jgi:hypothetical protein